MQQGEPEVYRLGRQELAGAHLPDRLERSDGIAQVQQERAADHHVERSEAGVGEVVDAQTDPTHLRTECLGRDPEADALLRAGERGQ